MFRATVRNGHHTPLWTHVPHTFTPDAAHTHLLEKITSIPAAEFIVPNPDGSTCTMSALIMSGRRVAHFSILCVSVSREVSSEE